MVVGWILALSVAGAGSTGERAKLFFFGLVPGAGPSFEKSLDRVLRERLHGVPEASLAGRSETATLKRRMDQNDYGRSSKAVLDALTAYTEEDDIVAWGRVEGYSIVAARRLIFGARAVGEATVSLNIYHPRTRRYLFVGEVVGESWIGKPPVWFRRVGLVTHITGRDRSHITEELTAEMAGKLADVIRAAVRHHFAAKAEGMPVGGEVEMPVEGEGEEAPSLDDLFSIPLSEPAAVELDEEGQGDEVAPSVGGEQEPGAASGEEEMGQGSGTPVEQVPSDDASRPETEQSDEVR
jgi:hypothetical protein